MKIFVTHSSDYDFQNELYEPLKGSQLGKRSEIIFPHEDGSEVVTKEVIKECDLIIAEVSRPSTGQGIELGWADMFQIPVVCIYQENSKPSRSLSKITSNFLAYINKEDMLAKLEEWISKKKD
ncbi:MAG: hypothetical protein Q8P55_02230 [bacterium]|nr:hypothetical protein [bacterium]